MQEIFAAVYVSGEIVEVVCPIWWLFRGPQFFINVFHLHRSSSCWKKLVNSDVKTVETALLVSYVRREIIRFKRRGRHLDITVAQTRAYFKHACAWSSVSTVYSEQVMETKA